MTNFLDGPAAGQVLMLSRAPRFLRVVQCGLKFDALDSVHDTPRENEKIHVYQLVGQPGGIFISARGGRGGAATVATYKLTSHQPEDEEVRGTDDWRDWTELNIHLLEE
ncbi:hypothetical protein JIN85_17085 [Luteolibacter pohnpeiensis]|uniref:Uncharacterized protein n=1 Tax=Luteolibacter pohnpeiensis TaxID=454153 RepID=A0A934VXR7_9BACT|nr:hypothetical protein [Luteolibacter pohnpeiensis]MBK1884138.1 hypothetical protein [Luteolibacter pohnpeiensis]